MRPLRYLLAILILTVSATTWLLYAVTWALWKAPRWPKAGRPHLRWLPVWWVRLSGRGRPRAGGPFRPPAVGVLPERMSGAAVGARRVELAARDGLWCQECGVVLRVDVSWREDVYPQVHHLASWSRNKHAWWVDALWNLCLLCGPCNRGVGAGSTPRLERLRVRLLDEAVLEGRVMVR